MSISAMAMASPTSPIQPPPPAAAAAMGGNASLYVGDLDPSVVEEQLYAIFSQVAPVASVRVCRDQVRRTSLGYGYVNFHSTQDANRAMDALNFTPVNGRSIRIMSSNRDPSLRKSGRANVFIKNLDPTIDNKTLHDIFASFGTVLSCKVACDFSGQSKGYGFVQFEHEESAQNAISQLNGMLVNGRKVFVGLFMRRQERDHASGAVKFTNVYIKNLPEVFTDDDLRREFGLFGEITSTVVMRDASGNSRCFGFVNFETPEAAAAAVENLNGKTFNDKVLYVGRAQKRAEREAELKAKFEQERNGRLEKLQGLNLYLKNLDDDIDDSQLRKLFSEFGEIESCKVMVDSQGRSKGSGFVAFTTTEAANRAMSEMNGKMIGRKPLYVAFAQRKEERRAMLMAHFAQINTPGNITPTVPSIPGYPGPPRIAAQQLYFGQGAPGLVPPQAAGFGFQQQLIPGIRPGVTPNFVMPYNMQRPRHPGQRMGVRQGGMSQQMQQQQMIHRNANQSFRYMSNARNGVDPAMLPQGISSPVVPLQLDGNNMHVAQMDGVRAPFIPSSNLTTALASANPDQQRIILGERLYPLVEQIEREQAGKVTGMLLEMDKTEVLHLIESPDSLQIKVAEAMEVLRLARTTGSDGTDLAGLTLND